MSNILPTPIEEEVRNSYLAYSMSVIVSRALPDVRDGLKPGARRILYAMYKLGLVHNHGYRKCATVVGEVLGKYHPHGDNAVYGTIVHMVQTFSMRCPLIDGQGNFGSIDGDNAAAYRYTEARMTQIAELMLQDIEKETVLLQPNFDNRLEEPTVLPSVFPNLLVNGTSGIAVGMATNLPPHNLGEVVDALTALIDDPDIEDFFPYIKGPDFPTGALIVGEEGIRSAYSTGRGKITLKAVTEIEENHRTAIIITELPYQVNKAELIKNIADLVRNKKIEGISNIRDESDRDGIRVVIELKNNAPSQIILNKLFKHTAMQTTFGVIMIVLQDGVPKLMTLKEILNAFLEHRYVVVKRRTEFDLKENEKRAHILEGLKIAVENIDEVVKIIRTSKTTEDAKKDLIAKFILSEPQVSAILDMRLARLVGLETQKLENEYKETIKIIKNLRQILSSKKTIMEVIKAELLNLKEKFADKRRTRILKKELKELDMTDLIANEPEIITLTAKGHIKRSKPSAYRKQFRGGKGLIAATLAPEDKIIQSFEADTHSDIFFLTNLGRCYKAKVYELPEFERAARGRSIVNILPLKEKEYIKAALPMKDSKKDDALIIVTTKGLIKKTVMSAYDNLRKTGIIAISLREGDEIAFSDIVRPKNFILMVTEKGKVIRFDESKVRACGRTAQGVRGIKIKGNDKVIYVTPAADTKQSLLLVTKKGYAKRVVIDKIRITNRGGSGVIGNKEELAMCELVKVDEAEILITTSNGKTLRTPVKNVRKMGRSARGVRVINLGKDDIVADVQVITEDVIPPEDKTKPAEPPKEKAK
ncbi:MAG: DNA gyrase subunit A [bacterium]|nr:DNA gyrase subunit A [bacterium]